MVNWPDLEDWFLNTIKYNVFDAFHWFFRTCLNWRPLNSSPLLLLGAFKVDQTYVLVLILSPCAKKSISLLKCLLFFPLKPILLLELLLLTSTTLALKNDWSLCKGPMRNKLVTALIQIKKKKKRKCLFLNYRNRAAWHKRKAVISKNTNLLPRQCGYTNSHGDSEWILVV